MMAESTRIRSATGSRILPSAETWPRRRASCPSTQSVAPSDGRARWRRRRSGPAEDQPQVDGDQAEPDQRDEVRERQRRVQRPQRPRPPRSVDRPRGGRAEERGEVALAPGAPGRPRSGRPSPAPYSARSTSRKTPIGVGSWTPRDSRLSGKARPGSARCSSWTEQRVLAHRRRRRRPRPSRRGR